MITMSIIRGEGRNGGGFTYVQRIERVIETAWVEQDRYLDVLDNKTFVIIMDICVLSVLIHQGLDRITNTRRVKAKNPSIILAYSHTAYPTDDAQSHIRSF
jgi:hypothetical protein